MVDVTLGEAARRRGDLDRAESYARAAAREALEIREMRAVADALDLLAAIAADRGATDRTATLVGAAATVRARARPMPRAALGVTADAAVTRARERLGADRFDELRAAGAALSDEEAVAVAVDDAAG